MRLLCGLILLLAFAWCFALALFVHAMPTQSVPPSVTTDAIVVLTGGNGRVERGFDMLAQGAAPVLLVSGVGQSVTLREMLQAHASAQTRQQISDRGASIVFDYVARTTQSNANEAAKFVRERGYHSIRLITAHYHMPRSLAEMQAALPDVDMVADPVFPDGFARDQWWRHKNSRALILSEFHKSIAVKLRPLLSLLSHD
jgi:uncharacterized SAM-binding protein YcdF (DUF218 family)